MPKANVPEISKGFWVTTGVLLAVFALGLISMIWQKIKNRAG